VMRSEDGGCGWSTVYRLPAVPSGAGDPSAIDSRIDQVVVGPLRNDHVFLVVTQTPDASSPAVVPHIVRSADGGQTWDPSTSGIPTAIGRPAKDRCGLDTTSATAGCGLVASTTDPDVLYFFDTPAAGGLDVSSSI